MSDDQLITGAPIRNIEISSISSSQLLQELAQAKAEKRKVSAIVESIDNGVIAVDWDGNIVLVNRACEEITGWSRRDVLGHFYWEVFPLFESNRTPIQLSQHPLIEAFSLDAQLKLHGIYVETKSGDMAVIDLIASPVKGVKNDIVSGIMTFRDISKQHKLEAMQEDFVSMAAHELRTPIVPLKGYLEILRDEASLTDEHRVFLMRAIQSAGRLENLISSLLSVARIERGSVAFHPGKVDFAALIQSVVKDFGIRAEAKKQKITLGLPTQPIPSVVGDGQMLREVLGNLISNAIKYTPDGGQITISTEVSEGKIVTHVQDTGVGFLPEDQESLFKKFHRVGGRLTGSIEGTGLGLYISKSLIDRHGGNIWAKSQGIDRGSIFSFSLPIASSNGQSAK